ncbi:type II toxin-antitoxin system death-on-curing family toxin [Leifsonia poae]|uniref:Fido domain-containing protein n=1 Tax=Leifsonia poae TaxID=110933 RepID=A0A9W6LY17_9MICO|nr:type II toxin-antitoxin system death-on-curing family toxin [Leifsonia poae]GLJ74743.1 hypothetical protein GCM10017584_03160 [Leifsonia poae]
MSRRPSTVAALAKRSGLESDDVLLTLWDAGLEYPSGPNSEIRARDLSKAETALTLAAPKEKLKLEYWMQLSGLNREELAGRLLAEGVSISPGARRVPKGTLRKFERVVATPGRPATSLLVPKGDSASTTPPPATFVWREIGHRKSLRYLTAEQIAQIHYAIADDFFDSPDPIAPAGIRFPDLLESAAIRPQIALGEIKKYPTVELSGAALMHSLIHNHPFYNGNKRTALVAILSALDMNGYTLTCDQKDLFRWTVRVAQHKLAPANVMGDRSDIEVFEMAQWIRERARPIDKGERVITWPALKRRLIALGCDIQPTPSRGGRMQVSRQVTVQEKKFLGTRTSLQERKYSLAYGGDGRQIGKGSLKELRQILELSEEHGYDSNAFYGSEFDQVDEFIRVYRKTLARLAKL